VKALLARILCSVARRMWQNEPTLGEYTSETAEHELNLAFHFAAELRGWFPWLDCDFDVTKRNFNRNRPDIILHSRNTAYNFLVVEVKREKSRHAVPADLRRIRENWFEGNLQYRFGAAIILDEDKQGFEAQVLSRIHKDQGPQVLKGLNMGTPLQPQNFSPFGRKTLCKAIDRIAGAKKRDRNQETSTLEREIDQLVYALYGLTAGEIALVESSTNGA